MTRLYVFLARPRLLLAGAVAANVLHPLIHGTPLDSGALDTCLLALNATALSCCDKETS